MENVVSNNGSCVIFGENLSAVKISEGKINSSLCDASCCVNVGGGGNM